MERGRTGGWREGGGGVAEAFELGDGFRAGAGALQFFHRLIVEFFNRFYLAEIFASVPSESCLAIACANHADDFRNSGGGLRSSRGKDAQQGDGAAQEHKSTIGGRCWGAAFSPTWVSQIPRIPV